MPPEHLGGIFLLAKKHGVQEAQDHPKGTRRLARDYERLPERLAGLHLVVLAIVFAARFIQLARLLAHSS
jgi:hypothetical protein